MATFIQQLAHALLKEHGHALGNVAVVLPSQRAALYLRDAIAKEASAPLWSPQLFTLTTFMEQLSALRVLSPEELIFEAYEAYRTIAGEAARPLDDFLQWGPSTLRDISEADAHRVPLSGYYRDLRSWEELDWSFNVDPLSEGQQRMVRYWAMAGKLHEALNERLLAAGTGTQGLVERTAADRLVATPVTFERIWFAGLNALTSAQRAVIDHLHHDGLARFAWDADTYYLNDTDQEAGVHLRESIARYGAGVVPPCTSLAANSAGTRVVRSPNTLAQVWCAADELRALPSTERGRTAVVLADGTLLQPLIEALPAELGPVNITMGLPVASLPAGALLSSFFTLHGGFQEGTGFFHADVERLLRHPFLHTAGSASLIDGLLVRIATRGHMRIAGAWLRSAAGELNAHAEVALDERSSVHERTLALIAWARAVNVHDTFATEQLYHAAIALRRVQRLLERYGHAADANAHAAVMDRVLRTAQVGLFGEPLSGVQVMGLLETRALDLDRVILVGAEEGKLPSNGLEGSFIPFELRRAYGLPLRDRTDAVQAYNFLRMLQRAKNVTLIHSEGDGSATPSRFIAQLRYEAFATPQVLQRISVRIPVPVRTVPAIQLPNNAYARERIEGVLRDGLSPSVLVMWLRCPLDFYFRKVLRLKEPEEPEARIGANVLGDALHRTMETIHAPWLGTPLRADLLRDAAGNVEAGLRTHLADRYTEADLREGEPLLQFGMARRSAERWLLNEASLVDGGARITPLGLERDLFAPLTHAASMVGVPVNVKGRLDRIDERDGAIHILDLKTGRVNPGDLLLNELTLADLRDGKRYGVQLLVYAWLYLVNHPQVAHVKAGLLPLQRPSESGGVFLKLAGTDLIAREHLPMIEKFLAEAVSAMLDPSVTFTHSEKSAYCVFCAKP